ncbi:hypothetical protein LCGC14_2205730 [marine sediment metagenome]|uniref:Uncharacterized protein n=1 Tax=marine sediment metagenome TaxID=412755 RepID=A0A0F9DFL0_9ZZZZ
MNLLKELLLLYTRGLKSLVLGFCESVLFLVLALVVVVTFPVWLPLYLGLKE